MALSTAAIFTITVMLRRKEKLSTLQLKKAILTWIYVLVTLSVLFVMLFGRTLWPQNQVFEWLWWLVWLGVLPVLLVLSFMILSKKNDRKSR